MFKMQLEKNSFKRLVSALFATAIGLAACLAPTTAMAAAPGWVRLTGNQLRIIVGSTEYYAYTAGSPNGCATVSSDTLKEYQSIAQTALLAGRNIGIGSYVCGGQNIITSIEIA